MLEGMTVEQCRRAHRLCKSFERLASLIGEFGTVYDRELVLDDERLVIRDGRMREVCELPPDVEEEQLLALALDDAIGLNRLAAAIRELGL